MHTHTYKEKVKMKSFSMKNNIYIQAVYAGVTIAQFLFQRRLVQYLYCSSSLKSRFLGVLVGP